MVKGVSRRVIVVKSPDTRYFEQAIFVVREDARGGGEILKEAQKVADDYIKANLKRRRLKISLPICLIVFSLAFIALLIYLVAG